MGLGGLGLWVGSRGDGGWTPFGFPPPWFGPGVPPLSLPPRLPGLPCWFPPPSCRLTLGDPGGVREGGVGFGRGLQRANGLGVQQLDNERWRLDDLHGGNLV